MLREHTDIGVVARRRLGEAGLQHSPASASAGTEYSLCQTGPRPLLTHEILDWEWAFRGTVGTPWLAVPITDKHERQSWEAGHTVPGSSTCQHM